MSKYGIFSGPYFPVFGPNTRKYGPKKTPYLDTFHTVDKLQICLINVNLYYQDVIFTHSDWNKL